MLNNEQLNSLFSITENEKDYEEEKRKKKQKLVRNEFEKSGKYGMPLIKKQNIDLDKIELLNYLKTKNNDEENKNKTIHFFIYDWNFETVYEKPELSLEKLDQYYALLTPEFSTYKDMPLARQIDSVFKNRWCGAFWQKQGMLVIPTISWGSYDCFEFFCEGVEEGSVVAVSTYTREDNKKGFMQGYEIMMEKIKPSAILCYGTPFKEMTGNIKAIDPYNREELINMLPKGAWNNDFSKTLSKKDWDKLRQFALKRANGKCEICGFETNDLDVHEEWKFNTEKKTQTLKVIVAICSRCHGVKHFKNSVRLGYGEEAQKHFMKVNDASEMEFASHLNKALLEYNERNSVYRWKIIADLEKFGGSGIEVKQNNIPLIKNPYENVEWGDYDYLKTESSKLFLITNNELYYSAPAICSINVDNYLGEITIICENVSRIEWYLDDIKVKTKYNVVGLFKTELKVKNLIGKNLKFKLIGTGGEAISKNFEILSQEVL